MSDQKEACHGVGGSFLLPERSGSVSATATGPGARRVLSLASLSRLLTAHHAPARVAGVAFQSGASNRGSQSVSGCAHSLTLSGSSVNMCRAAGVETVWAIAAPGHRARFARSSTICRSVVLSPGPHHRVGPSNEYCNSTWTI